MAVWYHSTKSMAASKALISGVALKEVCEGAGWSSPHTFVTFGFYSWTWTLPQAPKCSRPSAARKIHTGQALGGQGRTGGSGSHDGHGGAWSLDGHGG